MTHITTLADGLEYHGSYPGAIESRAIFDDQKKYRYLLVRRFREGGAALHYCMLNPATADENKDDPTIKRCIVRALNLGYSAVYISNIFALRSSDPGNLRTDPDPVGPGNDKWILRGWSAADKTVIAWGAFGFKDRGNKVLANLSGPLYCLGITKDGYPRHPLYVAYSEPFKEYARRWHP